MLGLSDGGQRGLKYGIAILGGMCVRVVPGIEHTAAM
jgi:hypothetical protein